MHSLLPVLSRDPRLLGEYVAALLRHDDVAQAEVQLSRLEQLAPQSFSVIMHRARLLVLQRSYDAALAEIQRYVGKPQLLAADALQRKKQAAALAEELGMLLDRPGFVEPSKKFLNLSETLYREYMQERPSEVLAFAMFLNRRGRTEEALAVCEEALQTNPAEAVAPVGIAILRQSAAPTADQLRRIEGWITAALRRQGNQESLRLYLADLRDLEGKYGDAEQLYREVLAANPRNVLAMNNLAWFLAAREPGNPEAAQLIDTALKITGPNAELLDTRGFVYYQMGEFQAAANDFEEATSDAPNAVKHFHLAQAFDRLNRRNDAVAELKKARELGLRSEQLHPLEREEFRKLSIALQ
jgi:tetratricopeptide (TPR) repeat protein